MKDLSIEYAHIYTNSQIGDEHKLSLQILGKFYEEEKKKGETISLVIMVDDYSFPDPAFDYIEFNGWLTEKGFRPDLMIRESQVIPICDEVLKLVKDEKLREEISSYVRVKKYPCSLFIAGWYLLRLGYLTSPIFDVEFVSKKLINILPISFKPFEEKALQIISSTDFADAINKIEYKYFEGRDIN